MPLTITGVVLGSIWPFIITLYIVAGVTGADPSTRGLLIAGVVAAPLGALNALSSVVLDRLCRKRVADVYATVTGLGERLQAIEVRQAEATAAQERAMVHMEQILRDAIAERYETSEELRMLPRRVMAAVDTLWRTVDGRIVEVEKRLDEQEKLARAMAQAEAILARADGVVPFPSNNGPRRSG